MRRASFSRVFSIFALAFFYFISLEDIQAQSRGRASGGEAGGGGSNVVAEFVREADRILEIIDFSEQHRAILTRALREARIEAVAVLKDRSGKALSDQESLVAYSLQNYIQLRSVRSHSGGQTWVANNRAGPLGTWHFIIHELFLASGRRGPGGQALDQNFDISIREYGLDNYSSARRIPAPPPVYPPANPLRSGEIDVSPCVMVSGTYYYNGRCVGRGERRIFLR